MCDYTVTVHINMNAKHLGTFYSMSCAKQADLLSHFQVFLAGQVNIS